MRDMIELAQVATLQVDRILELLRKADLNPDTQYVVSTEEDVVSVAVVYFALNLFNPLIHTRQTMELMNAAIGLVKDDSQMGNAARRLFCSQDAKSAAEAISELLGTLNNDKDGE